MVILLSTTAARAAQPRIVFAPGCEVTAGDVVMVGWEGLPPQVDEFEFLLSTGHGDLIRLTPELSPSDGSFRWTVPDLPSREAVLHLRAGIDGEEIVLASTDPFVIRGRSRSATIEFRDREWWMVTPAAPAAAPPVIDETTRYGLAAEADVPSRHAPLRAGTVRSRECRGDAHRPCPASIHTRCGAPLVVPQRI